MKITANGTAYDTILEACKGERVFSLVIRDGRFIIREECDGCFGFEMNREQVLALADEIRAWASCVP
jgi:hypothetical protein